MKPNKETVKYFEPVLKWLDNGAMHEIAFNMQYFKGDGEFTSAYEGNDLPKGCGSVCCIAGAISQFHNMGYDGESAISDCIAVGEKIGMSKEDAYSLFIPEFDFNLDNITPKEAAETIRRWIDTGEVVWDVKFAEDEYYE